jgi:hypothetical protein
MTRNPLLPPKPLTHKSWPLFWLSYPAHRAISYARFKSKTDLRGQAPEVLAPKGSMLYPPKPWDIVYNIVRPRMDKKSQATLLIAPTFHMRSLLFDKFNRIFHGSGSSSPASKRGGPSAIPGDSTWILRRTKWYCIQCISAYWYFPVTIKYNVYFCLSTSIYKFCWLHVSVSVKPSSGQC